MTWVVGLTGGIGSGKSAAADLFAAHGIAVVDTDAIAHELTAPGGAAAAPGYQGAAFYPVEAAVMAIVDNVDGIELP